MKTYNKMKMLTLWLLVLCMLVLPQTHALYSTILHVTPVTTQGSSSQLHTSLASLFSPISGTVSIDMSTSVLIILVSSSTASSSYFTSSVLSDVSNAASSAGYVGSFSTAVIGQDCSYTGSVPLIAGPNDTLPGVLDCTDSLSLVMTTATVLPSQAVVSAVCKTLGQSSCSNIAASVVDNEATVTVTTADPISALVTIRTALSTPSTITMLRITQLSAQGAVVYIQQALVIDQLGGDLALCAERLWYLTFLILLLPLMYVVTRYLYRRGAARGKSKAFAAHQTLRKNQIGLAQQLGFLPQFQQQQLPQN